MPNARFAVVLVLLLLMASAVYGQRFEGGFDRERSPFSDVVFVGGGAHVLVEGHWYEWLEIDGVPYDSIRAEARRRAPTDMRRRIAEDLVALLAGLEVQPGETVTLKLRSLEDQRVLVLPQVEMTKENRRLVSTSFRERQSQADHERLQRRLRAMVDAADVADELARVIRTHHAYADLKGIDLQAMARDEIERTGDQPTLGQAILAAQRVIARLGDGHAGVEDWLDFAPPGRLDFLLQHAEGGLVAFRRERRQTKGEFLDAEHPFVVSMDGVPVGRWIDAASAYVTDGSPALVRRRSAAMLRYVNLVRDEIGLPNDPSIEVRLRNADGSSTVDLELPITQRRGMFGLWPRQPSRVLDSGIGYIRLSRMHRAGADLDELEQELVTMADAPGLIIDVRGNGGGSRDTIARLVPWFLDPSTQHVARVVNVARARLSVRDDPEDPNGHLANRHAFPAAWPIWTERERAAIERFSETFKPQWVPPRGEYSVPHYMVVSRDAGQLCYGGPVVVLMDEGCFSATDIFLGALKGLPGVTLMGVSSSGGSARSRDHDVDTLGVSVTLASMVSYTPDGKLYDGNGIQPDVLVPVQPTDLVGKTDTQLDAAIRHLGQKLGQPNP